MLFLIFHSLNVSLHAYNGASCLLDVEVANHAREKAGIQDTCKQSRIAVITAAGKLLFCAVLPVLLAETAARVRGRHKLAARSRARSCSQCRLVTEPRCSGLTAQV